MWHYMIRQNLSISIYKFIPTEGGKKENFNLKRLTSPRKYEK